MTSAKIQVRFSDLDVLGHVNNSIYLSYFEMTRVHYFKALLGTEWDWKAFGVVLVKNEIEYKKPVLLHDAPEIEMFTEHIGDKSFTLGYHLTVNNELRTTGRSVMVCFDAIANKTISLPEEMRKGLNQLIKNL